MAHSLLSELRRPSTFNFATDVVDYWACNETSGPAMHWVSGDRKTERKLSFEHFSRQSHRIAVLLRDRLLVEEGAKMLIIMPRIPEWSVRLT
jgi:medium-chain acyl-CoA synthetase